MSPEPSIHPLAGRVAVVTGGARGIGAACAARLAAAGARVAVLDLSADDAARQARFERFERCDVADEGSVEAAFAAVRGALGPVELLVNAAGITVRARAVDMRAADFGRVIGVNLVGTFLCCREAARQTSARGNDQSSDAASGAAIVNVASIMGFSGGLFPNVAYNTSKGGVVNLTRTLAVEWAPLGIRVNAVAPTYVETDLTRGLLADPVNHRKILDAIPSSRLATAAEVAEAVLFLLSPASAMTTGHTLPVDGGFLAV